MRKMSRSPETKNLFRLRLLKEHIDSIADSLHRRENQCPQRSEQVMVLI